MGSTVSSFPKTSRNLRMLSLEELLSKDIPEREPILGSWLKQRHLNMTYAGAGVGKSMFTMSLALAVAGGGKVLDWEATRPRRVLIIDGEMDIGALKERAAMLMETVEGLDLQEVGKNLHLFPQQYQREGVKFPDIADEDDHQVFLQYAKEVNAELVVLDNYSTLASVDDENAASSFDPALSLLQKFRQANMAAILVHHTRKDGETYRGTSKMEAIFDSTIKLSRLKGVRRFANSAFQLEFVKFRERRDETIRTLEVRLEEGTDGRPTWVHEVSSDAVLAQLVELVKSCEFSTQGQLAAALGKDPSWITRNKPKAIALGMISERDWQACLDAADPSQLLDELEDETF